MPFVTAGADLAMQQKTYAPEIVCDQCNALMKTGIARWGRNVYTDVDYVPERVWAKCGQCRSYIFDVEAYLG